jgi:uncharacterized protein YjbI with pentapeptide repeats
VPLSSSRNKEGKRKIDLRQCTVNKKSLTFLFALANYGVLDMRITALVLLALIAAASPVEAACKHPPRPGVDWQRCNKQMLHLQNSDLTGANLQGAYLTGTRLVGSRLAGADLGRSELVRTSFQRTDLLAPISKRLLLTAPALWVRCSQTLGW